MIAIPSLFHLTSANYLTEDLPAQHPTSQSQAVMIGGNHRSAGNAEMKGESYNSKMDVHAFNLGILATPLAISQVSMAKWAADHLAVVPTVHPSRCRV